MADNILSVPSLKKEIVQPNNGDSDGNVFATYGIDLASNKGKIRVSEQSLIAIDSVDEVDFSGYAAAIVAYGGSTGKVYAVSDKVFSADSETPTTGWIPETAGSEPTVGNAVTDGVVFDGLLLVAMSTNIAYYNGSTWAQNWWTSVLGQAALASGERRFLKRGPSGKLYITDNGNKVYSVDSAGAVVTSGEGSLDFSATPHEFTCMEPTSTRMWIGTDQGAVIEWDMSENASTANRVHENLGAAVRCIAIEDDIPVVVLANGRVKYFNGLRFVNYPGARFPVAPNTKLDSDFIHPNGWAIIDGFVHFLVKGTVDGANDDYIQASLSPWYMPSGVWCLDPAVGLSHRYALPRTGATQNDYGQMAVSAVGALHALDNASSKFLASYEYFQEDTVGTVSVLAYHDATNTRPSKSLLATAFFDSIRDTWQNIELLHKELSAGDSIEVFFRYANTPGIIAESDVLADRSGVYASPTQLNVALTDLGIVEGNIALVKMGTGAGQVVKIAGVEESLSTTAITFTPAISPDPTGEYGLLEVLDFQYMGTVEPDALSYHDLSFPSVEANRKIQLLLVITQAAGNTVEVDYCIINK